MELCQVVAYKSVGVGALHRCLKLKGERFVASQWGYIYKVLTSTLGDIMLNTTCIT